MKSLKQKIATLEAQLAREKAKLSKENRAIETGQKVILGGMLISMARKDPKARAWVIGQIRAQVTRKIDLKRLQPLLEELEGLGQGQGAIPAGNGADKAQEGV